LLPSGQVTECSAVRGGLWRKNARSALWPIDIMSYSHNTGGMTWTQLTLTLPGGIRLDLISVHRPRVKTLPPQPPAKTATVETSGTEVDSEKPIGLRKVRNPTNVVPLRRAS